MSGTSSIKVVAMCFFRLLSGVVDFPAAVVCAGASFCFAVPSPSSDSSSDSCRSSRRLIVSSEGPMDIEELERDRDRRNHSSGMHNRKLREADDDADAEADALGRKK